MRWSWKPCALAAAMAFAFSLDAAARTRQAPKGAAYQRQAGGKLHGSYLRSLGRENRFVHARRGHGFWRLRRPGYVDLVGDPESGLGFYPLPPEYRYRAWRYRLHHRRPLWEDPVYFAMMADALRYRYDLVPANQGYRYGVFDPIAGVGTPFFGGYYWPGE